MGAGELLRIEAFFGGHAYDPHQHDTYGIGLTLAGVQSFDYRGARADSLAGDVIVLHPDETHDGRAGVEAGFYYRMAYIEPALLRGALDRQTRSLPFVPDAVSRDPRLVHAARLVLRDLDRDLEPLERDQFLLALADAMLAVDKSTATGRDASADLRAADRARAFLEAQFDRTVHSEELERETGLDRFALARSFRRRFGTSPYRYLTMRRLDRARGAILHGASLADAAALGGFADQSHMTRQFRRAYGVSPGRWRAMQRTTFRT